MAKGVKYKKTVKKRAFFSKRDMITLAAILAILAGAVAAFLIVANNSYVKLKDGVYQIEKDEIVADYGNDTSKKYKRIGTVESDADFALDDGSKNSVVKYLYPAGESDVASVFMGGCPAGYTAWAEYMRSFTISQYDANATAIGDITLAGRKAKYFTYIQPGTQDTDGDKIDTSTPDARTAMAYIDYDDGHCAFLQVNFTGTNVSDARIIEMLARCGEWLKLKGTK